MYKLQSIIKLKNHNISNLLFFYLYSFLLFQMQLFISDDFQKTKNSIIIKEKRIIDQLRKVLRAKPWYNFLLQNRTWRTIRYKLELENIWKEIIAKIIKTEENKKVSENKWIIQSILNKFDKMELIVQKLTEIWIEKIYFIPTERSVFKDIKDSKLERFKKIAIEAAEQSMSWYVPEIKVIKSFQEVSWTKAILDFEGENYKNIDFKDINFLVVWPEWWFHQKDLKNIKTNKIVSLQDKVLRSETASIIWGFILKS